jgi:hypothetical protein
MKISEIGSRPDDVTLTIKNGLANGKENKARFTGSILTWQVIRAVPVRNLSPIVDLKAVEEVFVGKICSFPLTKL